MKIPPFPELRSALTDKHGDVSLNALSQITGIPYPTLWRWEKHGIPATRGNKAFVAKLIEEHGLIIPFGENAQPEG